MKTIVHASTSVLLALALFSGSGTGVVRAEPLPPPGGPTTGGLPGSGVFETDHNGGQTVGVFLNTAEAYPGYTLFAPIGSTTTYLIDNKGRLIHTWESDYRPGLAAYLLDNGMLLRAGNYSQGSSFNGRGSGGVVQEIAWDGSVAWEFLHTGVDVRLHHDVEKLPNGNILMIACELKSSAEAIASGRDPALLLDGELWPDQIIEVDPETNAIVWEWHLWDHLVQDYDASKANYGNVAEHPELVDLNYTANGRADWSHTNAIDYNPQLDQIMVSVRNFNEIWIIDHSTSTAQAASHSGGNSNRGGDLLYRWGNPGVYRADNAQTLYGQHDAQWIGKGLPGEGNILIFNNGWMRQPEAFSAVEEITPPLNADGSYALSGSAYGPFDTTWHFEAADPGDFFSATISGAQRLPNGNTLICEGESGTFFEVTPEGKTVWRYVNPVAGPFTISQTQIPKANAVFRARRYGEDYPGLAAQNLLPGDTIETYVAPYFDYILNHLHIPELTATGLGTFQTVLQLVDGDPVTFDLLSLSPVDDATGDGAVYNPADGTLSLPSVTVGYNSYSVTLQHDTDFPGVFPFVLVSLE